MKMNMKKKHLALVLAALLTVSASASACAGQTEAVSDEATDAVEDTVSCVLTREDIEILETVENTADGEHAIEVSGEEASYYNTEVIKSGEADGDEADFYGENAAVFATDGAGLDLSDMVITTDGTHANAVFSYGEGTVVNIAHSVIETSGNCSGGLMTTGGGTMNASDLTIHTTGNSSAAIRSDRGGGTVTVTGGDYTTDGTGSPVIYSTADITVNDANLTSTASQGVVVEGKNSATLNNVSLTADNNTKNSDKSSYYQAVMIYQSMSGDAAIGNSSFSMSGGSLVNKNGDIFFVNNTTTDITLTDVDITNEDSEGVFLRAEAAGWGSEGSNGGQVTMRASDQQIDGALIVDGISTLNLYLDEGSVLTGQVTGTDADDQDTEGDVYVELTGGSKWVLTGDSYITSLTCEADSIDLNGYKLYVNGTEYTEGTASTGDAVEAPVSQTGSTGGAPGDGQAPPDGEHGAPGDGQAPPDGEHGAPGDGQAPPDGEHGAPGDGQAPPDKPE